MTTVNGQAIIRIYLQHGASLDTANAQVTAISQTGLRQFPPGTLPPLILSEVVQLLLRESISGKAQLQNGHARSAVVDDQRREGPGRLGGPLPRCFVWCGGSPPARSGYEAKSRGMTVADQLDVHRTIERIA